MVDGRTEGARVPQSACLRSEARGVCEARGAVSRRSRSRHRTTAHKDRRQLASRLLGRLLIPFGGRTGAQVKIMSEQSSIATRHYRAAATQDKRRGKKKEKEKGEKGKERKRGRTRSEGEKWIFSLVSVIVNVKFLLFYLCNLLRPSLRLSLRSLLHWSQQIVNTWAKSQEIMPQPGPGAIFGH
jgi:hypothetical protein